MVRVKPVEPGVDFGQVAARRRDPLVSLEDGRVAFAHGVLRIGRKGDPGANLGELGGLFVDVDWDAAVEEGHGQGDAGDSAPDDRDREGGFTTVRHIVMLERSI